MKPLNTLLLATLLTATASALAAAPKPINVSRAVAADASVQVTNLAGSIKIIGWNKSTVHVTGTLGNPDERLDVNDDKHNLDIRVIYPNNNGWPDNGMSEAGQSGTRLVVHVPMHVSVQTTSVSANVTTSGVIGTQRIRTVSGNITLATKAKEIDAQTVSGNIEAHGSADDAHVELDTVSGTVHASDMTGELTGQTVTGKVVVEHSRLQRVHLNSTAGTLEFNSSIEDNGDYKFNTTSGEISINLPRKPNAEFDITTFSGSIDNAFGPKPEKTSQYVPSLKLHFTSGKGGAYVSANSMSGNISLKAGS